jgi:ribosomal protein S18
MRYGFFVRSNTEKYLSKKELMAEVVTMLEWHSEKAGKQKHFLKLSEKQSYLIDRKNESLLKLFITRFGQIKPRKYTGLAVRLQKKMREQILRGRELWVVEFTK